MKGVTASASSPVEVQKRVLSREDFLKLLIAEIRYQNPLEPTGAQDLLDQTLKLTLLEMLGEMEEALKEFTSSKERLFLEAVGLIGKEVETKTGLRGKVQEVSFREGNPVLTLEGGEECPLLEVTKVGVASGGSAN